MSDYTPLPLPRNFAVMNKQEIDAYFDKLKEANKKLAMVPVTADMSLYKEQERKRREAEEVKKPVPFKMVPQADSVKHLYDKHTEEKKNNVIADALKKAMEASDDD